ncbi:MAG: NAD(P)H-dependent oxidoreductase [Planctomycetota bacterium]
MAKKKPSILIVYYSKSGHTKKMAELIEEGVKSEGINVETKKVENTTPEDLLKADGIIVGSPTYYGQMSGELKKLFDESVKYHGKLEGKVGAAFASSGVLGGGNETTVQSILNALLIHGMIIQGDHVGGHYGAVSIGKPDKRQSQACIRIGQRTAKLVKKLL